MENFLRNWCSIVWKIKTGNFFSHKQDSRKIVIVASNNRITEKIAGSRVFLVDTEDKEGAIRVLDVKSCKTYIGAG